MSGYIRNVISSYSAQRAGNKCLLFLDVVYSKVILNQCKLGLISQVKDVSIMKPFHNIWITSMYWLQIEFRIIISYSILIIRLNAFDTYFVNDA